jgi:hypothetical protein
VSKGNAAQTARDILASHWLFRLGIASLHPAADSWHVH